MANLEHMSFSSEQLISQVLEMKAGAENKIKTLEEMKKKAQELIDSQTKFIEDVNKKIEDYIVILHSLDELLNDPIKAVKNPIPLLRSQMDNLKEK